MKNDQERIPRKPSASQAAESKGPGRSRKHCVRCAEFSPSVMDTHNTKDCLKWNRDGTPKGRPGNNPRNSDRRKANYATAQSQSAELKECFSQMKRKQKALKKLILKQGKKRSRKHTKHHVLWDNDNSSDSD